MTLQQQVCTLQQAKRLKELGIEQESSLAYYYTGDTSTNVDHLLFRLSGSSDDPYNLCFAAFTVSELFQMIPEGSTFGGDWYMRYCWKGISFGYNRKNAGLPHIEQAWYKPDEIAIALADLLIHLLENNLVTASDCNKRLANG